MVLEPSHSQTLFNDGVTYSANINGHTVSITSDKDDGFANSATGLGDDGNKQLMMQILLASQLRMLLVWSHLQRKQLPQMPNNSR